jgi:hypothetical protein
MKKFHILGVALIAVFAVGVLSAATASALTFLLAEWLENGSGITATLLAEIAGELLLQEKVLFLGVEIVIDALCSGILDGFIGPDGASDITELLNLKEEAINLTALVELGLECVNDENCAEPLAWAVNLPWLDLLELMEDGTETFFIDLLAGTTNGNVGYYVDCMGSGLTDTCTAPQGGTKVESIAEGINFEFSEPFTELAGLKLANCEVAGAETGIVEGLGLLKVSGGTVTPSE